MTNTEQLQKFEMALKESAELRERFQKLYTDFPEDSSEAEKTVKVAAELGFTLSLEEVERSFAKSQNVDDEELENVAGGVIIESILAKKCTDKVMEVGNKVIDAMNKWAGFEEWCVYDYYCYLFFR